MVVRFDTISPTRHAHEGAKSIAAMVASCASNLSQWPAKVKVLDDKPVDDVLAQLLMERLGFWKKKSFRVSQGSGKYPKNIIIYRNGLTLMDEKAWKAELRSIETAFKAKWAKDGEPKLTLIAVNKDHHAKLRTPKSLNQHAEKQTIPANHMVIRTIHDGERKPWEFVIQGQQPFKEKEGEKNPAELGAEKAILAVCYSVLKGDIFTPGTARENPENLTHAMSYLSGSSTSTVPDSLPIYYIGLLTKAHTVSDEALVSP